MKTAYLTCPVPHFDSIALSSNDHELFSELSYTYSLECNCSENIKRHIEIVKNPSGYSVFDNTGSAYSAADKEHSLGIADAIIDSEYRSWAQGAVCTLHSFGIASCGMAVALLGTSGSGKTTLGIACIARELAFIGDEYGFLDLDSGLYWHAGYPVPVKRGTDNAVGKPLLDGTAIITPYGVESQLIPARQLLRDLGGHDKSASLYPLGAVILLRRHTAHIEPTAKRIPISDWPESIMQSIDGSLTRMKLFVKLIKTVAAHHIDVFELEYSNCLQAARWISKAMNEKARLMKHV